MKPHYPKKSKAASHTSWEPVERWYHSIVGEEGHYYHKQIILPGILRLAGENNSLLDLACGTAVLGRQLPAATYYMGVDAAPSLIKAAESYDKNPNHHYLVADITKPLNLQKKEFDAATIVLAVQNLQHPEKAFHNACKHLKPGGKLIIVMNHPCFRIPRQSSWGVDEGKKIQYRRVDRYATPMEIPILAHPGKGAQSPTTLSFHHPLSDYTRWLHDTGFTIDLIEEWCSDKVSTGAAAKMENRSRSEIPLFLTIVANKKRT